MQRVKKRRSKPPGQGHDYPKDDGNPRIHWRWNWVCKSCKTHTRRALLGKPIICPKCQNQMKLVDRRVAIPRKQDQWWNDPKEGFSKWQPQNIITHQ